MPSVICGLSAAIGRLNNPLPSPWKNDADEIFCTNRLLPIIASPLTSNEPVIDNEPVNSCKSVNVSPNLFEPDEKITEDDIISTNNSLATIRLLTYKSPVTLTSPFTSTSPSNDDDTFTKNPVWGEIDADAEPDINNFASFTKGILVNCEPSPWNEPLNEPLNSGNCNFVTNKRLPNSSDATSATELLNKLPLAGTPKLGSASFNLRNSYLSSDTSCGSVTFTLPLNNWLIYVFST